MKTRSNMPLFVVETDNVKALSNSQIDLLRCGDYLVKKDASGEHAYKVTYKSDTGMCLTYMDAYCVETQSYDKVDGNWVYNSEDKTIIAEPQLENIVDKDGHDRFIEGDIPTGELLPSGVEKMYGKWSLSGTHLMIVLAFKIPANTLIDNNIVLGHLDLPNYILNKIYPITTAESPLVVRFNDVTAYTQNFGSAFSFKTRIDKVSNGIDIKKTGETYSQTNTTFLTIAYDLLIDNE